MNESHEKELERQRSEKIRLEIEYKRWKQDNPEYDPNKDPVSHDFLKDKKPKPLSKKEKLELKYKEKISNPDYNLFLDQDFDLHAKRLSQFRRSKWRGEIYYMGQRGGIYTLTEGGTRNYKY